MLVGEPAHSACVDGMIEYRQQARQALRSLVFRALTIMATLRAHHLRVLLGASLVAAMLAVFVACILWRAASRNESLGIVEPGGAEAAFLIVCNECQARIRMDEPPTR